MTVLFEAAGIRVEEVKSARIAKFGVFIDYSYWVIDSRIYPVESVIVKNRRFGSIAEAFTKAGKLIDEELNVLKSIATNKMTITWADVKGDGTAKAIVKCKTKNLGWVRYHATGNAETALRRAVFRLGAVISNN